MTEYRIAIPSLGRPHLFVEQTLALLAQRGIDVGHNVDVFVTPDEWASYEMASRDKGLLPFRIIADERVHGMNSVRNLINGFYMPGTLLVQIDDDVRDVQRLDGKRLASVRNLDRLFREGFAYMRKGSARLWGPYPSSNPLSMKPGVDYGLGLVAGPLFGHEVRHGMDIDVPAKTDYEWTLLHWLRDGAVCRLKDVCVVTRYRQAGGLGPATDARRALEAAAVKTLVERYGGLLRVAEERKSGFPELRFVRPRRQAVR